MSLATRALFTGAADPGPYSLAGPYSPDRAHDTLVLAQFHCHTTESDGSQTPAQVVGHYQGAGYGALVITDHDLVTSQPAGIATALEGNETSPTQQHIVAIDSDYTRGSETDPQTIIDGIVATGGEAEFAHPNWSIGMTVAEMAALDDWLGLEIHNSGVVIGGGVTPSPTSSGFAVEQWDELLTDHRRDIWGFSVDDLHWIVNGETWDVGRCKLWMASNTGANLMASVRAGDFVADVCNHGITPGWPARHPKGVYLSCSGATRIKAYGSGGALLSTSEGESMQYLYAGGEHYVRLVAEGAYSEGFGSALDHYWDAVEGTWNVSGGIISVSNVTAQRLLFRRQLLGEFSGSVQVRLGATDDYGGFMYRCRLDASYFYLIEVGNGYLWLSRVEDGAATSIAQVALTTDADTWYTLSWDHAAGTLRAKAWETGESEPDWMLTASDVEWEGGAFGLRARGDVDYDDLYIDGFKTYYQPIPVG